MKKKWLKYITALIFVYLMFVVILFINNDYSLSILMPFASVFYGICVGLVFIRRPKAFRSISVLIIFLMNFLRMVIIPAIYVSSGYVSSIDTDAGIRHLNSAVLLVCLELFCTVIYIIASKKILKITRNEIGADLNENIRMRRFVKWIIGGILCIAIICAYSDKSILSVISTIFDRFVATDEMNVERRIAWLNARENSSIVFQLFSQAVYYLQILLPAVLLSYAAGRRKENAKSKGFLIGIVVAFLSVLVVSDNNIDSVCILLACLLVLYSAFEYKMNKLLPVMGIGVIGFILMFLLKKSNVQLQGGGGLSRVLCAYFASFPNISCGFELEYTNKLITLWGDIVSGVPYLVFFFKGLPNSLTLFNFVSHGYGGITNQIMPLISYGYLHQRLQFYFIVLLLNLREDSEKLIIFLIEFYMQ